MHSAAPSDPALFGHNESKSLGQNINNSVLGKVLQFRQAHASDQLFAVSDYDIITELHSALSQIKGIVNEDGYLDSIQSQSVVELVLSRITAAIRETNCIETYAPALVDLFENCLHNQNLVKRNKINSNVHGKLAAEIMSTLFLYHSKASVMTVTIPSTVKALDSADSELVKSASSYLSLGAVHNGRVLAQYAVQLISKVLKGNLQLLRVLSHIYPENKEPFHAHLSPLLTILYNEKTDTSEKLALLQLISMIANVKPDLVVPHLSEFDDFLLDQSTCSSTLHIFTSLISVGRVNCMAGQLLPLRRAVQQSNISQHNLVTIIKILTVIARTSQQLSVVASQDIIRASQNLSSNYLAVALKEVEIIAQTYPLSIVPLVDKLRDLCNGNPAVLGVFSRIQALTANYKMSETSLEKRGIDSRESLLKSNNIYPNDPLPLHEQMGRINLIDDRSVGALDRNTMTLAESYRNKDNGASLPRRKSRSFNSMHGSRSIAEDPCHSAEPELDVTDIDKTLMLSNNPCSSATLPPLPKVLYDGVHFSADSRVRPVSHYSRNRGPLNWALEDINTTTTFPVVHHRKGHFLTNSSIKMVDEHQLRSKQSSRDTLVGRSSQMTNERKSLMTREERGDVVRQFVEHRRSKIRRYVTEFSCRYPIPVKCTVEGVKGSKVKMRVHFACHLLSPHCLFSNVENLFAFKTKLPATWLHLMFLHVQVAHIHHTNQVLDQDSIEFKTLQHCWECMPKDVTHNRPFVTLVTSAFPASKEQNQVLKELQESRFFDSFVYMAPEHRWACFSCAHPDKTKKLLKSGDVHAPLLEGQLKEKKGKWRLFRRWHTKRFTLSNQALIVNDDKKLNTWSHPPVIDLCKIKSVRSLSRKNRRRKSLPRAFEIFTEDDRTFTLKANNQNKAQEWLHCLQIAVAQAQRYRLQ